MTGEHRTITDILVEKYTDICTIEQELEFRIEEVQFRLDAVQCEAENLYQRLCETDARHQAYIAHVRRSRDIYAEIERLP